MVVAALTALAAVPVVPVVSMIPVATVPPVVTLALRAAVLPLWAVSVLVSAAVRAVHGPTIRFPCAVPPPIPLVCFPVNDTGTRLSFYVAAQYCSTLQTLGMRYAYRKFQAGAIVMPS